MPVAVLSVAIRDRADAMRNADQVPLTLGQLSDNAELLLVLARIVDGETIERAFGAPGDWGYSTPIGAALATRLRIGKEASHAG